MPFGTSTISTQNKQKVLGDTVGPRVDRDPVWSRLLTAYCTEAGLGTIRNITKPTLVWLSMLGFTQD